jgi:hypothetical protein
VKRARRVLRSAWLHYLLIGIVPIGLAWLYVGTLLREGVGLGFPLDDSWIHLRFAENLASGHGFAFNPDQPSTGATSPLWILVLAAGLVVMRSPFVAAYVLGVAFTIAACVVVYKIALTLLDSRGFALAAGVLTAITAPMAWASLSGMEPPLYTFLTLLGIYAYLGARAGRARLNYAWPALLALATLARPECGLVFVLALADAWLLELQASGRRALGPLLRLTGLSLAIFVALLLPDLVRNLVVSGRPFPSTLYAKTQSAGVFSPILSQIQQGDWTSLGIRLFVVPRRWLVDTLETAANNNPLLLILFGVGLVEIVRLALQDPDGALQGPRGARSPEGRHRSLLLPLIILAVPLLMAVLTPVAMPSFQDQRHVAHLVPMFVLVGLLGAFRLAGLAGACAARSRLRIGLLGLLLALTFGTGLLMVRYGADRYALGVKNINRLHVAVAVWLRDHTPRDAVVAAQDVGAIGAIADRRVVDLGGLVTPEIIPFKWDDRRTVEYLERVKPDYLVILPVDRPILRERTDLFTPVYAAQIPSEDLLTASSNYIVVYRTIWARG